MFICRSFFPVVLFFVVCCFDTVASTGKQTDAAWQPAAPCVMISVQDGAWNDPASWSCNRIPSVVDTVLVQHQISVPGNYVAAAWRLNFAADGRLRFGTNARLKLYGCDQTNPAVCVVPTAWEFSTGDTKYDVLRDVIQTPDRGYIAVGSITSTTSSYGTKGWIVKYDEKGIKIWEKKFTKSGSYFSKLFATTDGNFAVFGSTSTGLWFVKIDNIGTILKNIETTYSFRSVSSAPNGTFVVLQSLSSYYLGDYNNFIVVDINGIMTVGPDIFPPVQYVFLKVLANGNYAVFAQYADTPTNFVLYTPASVKLSEKQIDTFALGQCDVTLNADGTMLLVRPNISNPADPFIWYSLVTKINSAGTTIWSKWFNSYQLTRAIETKDKGYMVAGYATDFIAGKLIKLNVNGTITNTISKDYNASGAKNFYFGSQFYSLFQTADDGFVGVGLCRFSFNTTYEYDGLLCKEFPFP